MRREPGTYGILENWVLEAMRTLRNATEKQLLLELAMRSNYDYKSQVMGIGELHDLLGLDVRSIQAATASLERMGYILKTRGELCLYGACTDLEQRLYKSTRIQTPKNAVQDDKNIPPEGIEGFEEIEQEQNIKHTHIQISEPVPVSDSANATSDVLQIPDSNFWEEMPDLDELETLASLEHQAETVFVPSQESPIKKIELEEKAQPDLKKVSGAAAGPVGKIVDKSPTRFNPREVDLPESIPREAWLEWCQHRTEKRSPLTPISVKKQLAQLLEFEVNGQTPQESIDHAIAHSWQGFYPIRKARVGYVGKPQTTQEANERMVDSAAALYAACLEQDRAKAAQRSLNA